MSCFGHRILALVLVAVLTWSVPPAGAAAPIPLTREAGVRAAMDELAQGLSLSLEALTNACGLSGVVGTQAGKALFSDCPTDGDWLLLAYGLGVTNGCGDGVFAPGRQVTQAELEALSQRVQALLEKKPSADALTEMVIQRLTPFFYSAPTRIGDYQLTFIEAYFEGGDIYSADCPDTSRYLLPYTMPLWMLSFRYQSAEWRLNILVQPKRIRPGLSAATAYLGEGYEAYGLIPFNGIFTLVYQRGEASVSLQRTNRAYVDEKGIVKEDAPVGEMEGLTAEEAKMLLQAAQLPSFLPETLGTR